MNRVTGETPPTSTDSAAVVDTIPEATAVDPNELDGPDLFVNRELSLLEFQRRVLEEARDESNPPLERMKFLSILGSNLDEFFMIRVAGLKQQLDAGVVDRPPDGMTPSAQLAAIRKVAADLYRKADELWRQKLQPELEGHGVHILPYADLRDKQLRSVAKYFDEHISPVLTPLAVDPGRPFPHISSLSLNLAVVVRDSNGEEKFARLKVPSRSLPSLVPIKRSSGATKKDGTAPRNHYFVPLEEVIAAHLDQLFPGLEVVEAHPFRIARDADQVFQELEAADLLEATEQTVWRRQFGSVVMLAVKDTMPESLRELLVRNLEMDGRDVYTMKGPLALSALMSLATSLDRPDLKDKPFHPAVPAALASEEDDGDVFAAIRRQDILLHHPFDSFKPVVSFLRQAARDPKVLAIKQTLYRVGSNSPVVDALLEARQNHKEVAVLLELKARFDEESNMEWARALEREGVHVIYGLLGLKTHSKIALVVREENDRIRRYVHLSTGNYNVGTAQVYTDIGLFTCDPDFGADASDLFNYLTGYSERTEYRQLIVAPIRLRQQLEHLVRREIEHQKAGRGGRIILKMNSLADKQMELLLYDASKAGVEIDLIVRGICCLRPGVPGVSETIRVRSIVGRFLEHSRIYWFQNGGEDEVYLGSPDIMTRNLDHRVEVAFPVRDPKHVRYLRDDVLQLLLDCNVKARRMNRDGSYSRVEASEPINAQERLLARHAAKKPDA